MEILIDPIVDALKTLPFLFLAFLLVEYLTSKNVINKVLEHGKLGPVVGSFLGSIPQCGFSVIAARLYSMRYITMGTILAIFMATSDEALPILIVHPQFFGGMMLLIILKIIVGALTGLAVDWLNHKNDKDYEWIQIEDCQCGCQNGILKPAITHTLKIFAFILGTNIAMTLLMAVIGEATVESVLKSHSLLQPVFAGLVGFIPNCSGSVILTQLYIQGNLTFGALFTGLTTSAGVGTFALVTYNENKKDTLKVLAISYIVALILGYLLVLIL